MIRIIATDAEEASAQGRESSIPSHTEGKRPFPSLSISTSAPALSKAVAIPGGFHRHSPLVQPELKRSHRFQVRGYILRSISLFRRAFHPIVPHPLFANRNKEALRTPGRLLAVRLLAQEAHAANAPSSGRGSGEGSRQGTSLVAFTIGTGETRAPRLIHHSSCERRWQPESGKSGRALASRME